MRKRRTRQHQIEDLSYNFVEKQVLEAFFVFKRYLQRDYGYDGTITTFNTMGEVEPGVIFVQVKASERLLFSPKNSGFRLPLSARDLELWLSETFPVLLVLYDASEEQGYFVELQSFFVENRLSLQSINKTKSIFVGRESVLSPDAVRQIGEIKNEMIWNL